MKIALYHHTVCNYNAPFEVSATADEAESWSRASEPVDVEFPPLPREQQVALQLAALDTLRENVTVEFGSKLADIDRRRAELLAIAAPTTTEETT